MDDLEVRQKAIRDLGDRAYEMADLFAWSRGRPEAEIEDVKRVWALPSYRAKREIVYHAPINLLREKILTRAGAPAQFEGETDLC